MDIDNSTIIGGVIAFLFSVFGFGIKKMRSDIDDNRRSIVKHRLEVSEQYVKKADYKEDIAELKDNHKTINQKLDKILEEHLGDKHGR